MGKRKKKQHTESGAGVLETGSLQDHTFPQLLHLPSLPYRISSLACGGAHVIALTSGGKVLTWGRGSSGQLDQGEVVSYALNPEPVTSLDDYFITHVSAGWSHSAFVSGSSMNQVYGFGSWKRGQLGISRDKIKTISVPEFISELEDMKFLQMEIIVLRYLLMDIFTLGEEDLKAL